MKKLFFLILTIGIALVLDIFFTPGGNVVSLFVIGAVCYWFWRLTLARRLFLALGIGSLLDVVGFLPMGVHMIIFIVMAYLCEFMKDFFSNNKSRAVIALNIIILMIIFGLLTPPVFLLTRWFQDSFCCNFSFSATTSSGFIKRLSPQFYCASSLFVRLPCLARKTEILPRKSFETISTIFSASFI